MKKKTLEYRIGYLEAVLASVTVNLAVLVDKLHGNDVVKEEDFMKAIKRDVDLAKDLLEI